MKRLLIAMLAGAAALLAPAAQATPPDTIWIEDQPFAASSDKFFVLRITTDNLGVYSRTHSETFLVEIDVATGEERIWLVYRAHVDREAIDASGKEQAKVTLYDREDWHDPYAIVADAGAALAPIMVYGTAEELANPADGVTYAIPGWSHLPGYTFSRSASLAQAERSLTELAGSVLDAERLAPISTLDLYPTSLE